MKKLFFVFIFILPMVSSAEDCKNYFPVGKAGAKKVYIGSKAKCEAAELVDCFCIDSKAPAESKVVQVDDLDSPKYTKEDSEACSGRDDCFSKIATKNCSAHGEGSFSVVGKDLDEIYCAKPDGFNKKMALADDAAGKANVAAKAAEQSAKQAKRQARLDALELCAKTKIADMTATVQKNCLRQLTREMVRSRLNSSDM